MLLLGKLPNHIYVSTKWSKNTHLTRLLYIKRDRLSFGSELSLTHHEANSELIPLCSSKMGPFAMSYLLKELSAEEHECTQPRPSSLSGLDAAASRNEDPERGAEKARWMWRCHRNTT